MDEFDPAMEVVQGTPSMAEEVENLRRENAALRARLDQVGLVVAGLHAKFEDYCSNANSYIKQTGGDHAV